jgi:hypothetical protein
MSKNGERKKAQRLKKRQCLGQIEHSKKNIFGDKDLTVYNVGRNQEDYVLN